MIGRQINDLDCSFFIFLSSEGEKECDVNTFKDINLVKVPWKELEINS